MSLSPVIDGATMPDQASPFKPELIKGGPCFCCVHCSDPQKKRCISLWPCTGGTKCVRHMRECTR